MSGMQQPRLKRKHALGWAIGLGCVGLTLLLGIAVYYAGRAAWRSLLGASGVSPQQFDEAMQAIRDVQGPPPPRAGVRLGQPLKWRTAYRSGMLDRIGGQVLTGQFDADSDTELLLISTRGASRLVQPDGQSQGVGVQYPIVWDHWVAWDYDGDGRDEVVPTCSVSEYNNPYAMPRGNAPPASPAGQPNASQLTPVLDLDGRIVAQLYGQGLMGLAVGRLDGAAAQLMLTDTLQPGKFKRIFYGPQGVKTGALALQDAGLGICAGDVDGDGKEEIVDQRSDGSGMATFIRAYSNGRQPRDLFSAQFSTHFHVLDVTGDGRAEVFTSYEVFRDLAAGKDVALQLPPAVVRPAVDDFGTSWIAAGDLLGTGQRLIALGYGSNVGITALMLFEPSGKCVYYEEFGRTGEALVKLAAGGRDILCIVLDNKVLMYP